MSITVRIRSLQETVEHHASMDWQCPECFGVQVECFEDRFHIQPDRFECRECGCTWHRGEG